MLKWNYQDVAKHCKVRPRDIEMYERGLKKLEIYQVRELYNLFTHQGVVFTSTAVSMKKQTTKEAGQERASKQAAQAEAWRLALLKASKAAREYAEKASTPPAPPENSPTT